MEMIEDVVFTLRNDEQKYELSHDGVSLVVRKSGKYRSCQTIDTDITKS